MDHYDCVLKLIGDEYIIAKKYGARIKKRERSKKTDDELQAEIKKIKMDASLSDVAKMTKIAISENNGSKEKISKEKETQVPKGRKLTMKEKETFSDLMDMNFKPGDKYVTLTYAKEDVTLDEASQDFDNWVKRMRERYSDFKYLGVRSFQERGTVHFHLLMTIPDIPIDELRNGVFQGIWGHGHVDIVKIYSLSMIEKYAKLKNYLIKNLREFKADERSFGKNLLLKSKNLENPKIIKGTYKEIMEYLNNIEGDLKKIDGYRFSHDYLNYITSVTFKRIRNKKE